MEGSCKVLSFLLCILYFFFFFFVRAFNSALPTVYKRERERERERDCFHVLWPPSVWLVVSVLAAAWATMAVLRGQMALRLLLLLLLVMGLALAPAGAFRGSRAHRKKRSRMKRQFPKYKHHPVGPEEDYFADEVYPKGLYDGDSGTGAAAQAAPQARSRRHHQQQQQHEHERDLSVDQCVWQGTVNDTSCGAETEAECYVTALEHEAAGTAETMNLVLARRFIDDTCRNSNTENSEPTWPHPLIDLQNETDPVATCCFVGQTVDPCFFDYGRSSYSCPYVCTADDILTDVKREFINSRLDWVEEYFATLFKTRPLIAPIEVNVNKESTRRLAGVSGTAATYPSDVHLVIVTTAQPSGIMQGIAGYAIALQSQ